MYVFQMYVLRIGLRLGDACSNTFFSPLNSNQAGDIFCIINKIIS